MKKDPPWARDVPIPDPPGSLVKEARDLAAIAVPDDGGAHARELAAAQRRPMSPVQARLYTLGAARLQTFRRWVGGLWWKPKHKSSDKRASMSRGWRPAHDASMFDLLSLIPFVALDIAPTLRVIQTPRGTLENWPRDHHSPLPVARVVSPPRSE